MYCFTLWHVDVCDAQCDVWNKSGSLVLPPQVALAEHMASLYRTSYTEYSSIDSCFYLVRALCFVATLPLPLPLAAVDTSLTSVSYTHLTLPTILLV